MKKILIFGGFGFIGSNVLDYIDKNYIFDYDVIVFDKYSLPKSKIKYKCIKQIYTGDFTDTEYVDSIISNTKPDIIIHSLTTIVPASEQNNNDDVKQNLLPLISLLDSMKKHNCNKLIYLSSGGAIYGNSNEKFNEMSKISPISSYGAIKACSEIYIDMYSKIYGINYKILRISNPYGPYHYSEKQGVINVFMNNMLNDKPIKIYTPLLSTKDYIYVGDVAKIIMIMADNIICNPKNDIYNVGSQELLSLYDIIEYLAVFKNNINIQYINSNNCTNVINFSLDINKLLNDLPKDFEFTNIGLGLEYTYNWELSKINNNENEFYKKYLYGK